MIRFITSCFTFVFAVGTLATYPAAAEQPTTMPATQPAQTPKEMLKSYNAAMRSGDAAAIEKLFITNNEAEQRIATTLARSEVQVGSMLVAAEQKFGADGVARIGRAFGDLSDADIDASEVKIEGERAIMTFPRGGTEEFLLVDGQWKISIGNLLQSQGADAEAVIDNYSRRGNFAKVLAQDILAGTVKTADEAVKRIEARNRSRSEPDN